MKTKHLAILITGYLFVASCSTSYITHFEKRQHRKGFHVETSTPSKPLEQVGEVKKNENNKKLITPEILLTADASEKSEYTKNEILKNSLDTFSTKNSNNNVSLTKVFIKKKKITKENFITKVEDIKKKNSVGKKSNTAKADTKKDITKIYEENKGLLVLLVGLGLILLAIILASTSIALWGIAGLLGGIGAVLTIVGLIVLLINA